LGCFTCLGGFACLGDFEQAKEGPIHSNRTR
jgi:hypothetical protein